MSYIDITDRRTERSPTVPIRITVPLPRARDYFSASEVVIRGDVLGVNTVHPSPQIKCKNNHVEFHKRLHGNIQYIQKQPRLLKFLDLV